MFFRLILAALLLAAAASGGVTVRLDLFPSDALTVKDEAQKTGLRLNLPLPDCDAQPADCRDLGLLNELDGFSPNTILRVRFSGAVDAGTLKDGIRLVALGDPPARGRRAREREDRHVGRIDDRVPHLRTTAGHEIDDAGRDPGLGHQLV